MPQRRGVVIRSLELSGRSGPQRVTRGQFHSGDATSFENLEDLVRITAVYPGTESTVGFDDCPITSLDQTDIDDDRRWDGYFGGQLFDKRQDCGHFRWRSRPAAVLGAGGLTVAEVRRHRQYRTVFDEAAEFRAPFDGLRHEYQRVVGARLRRWQTDPVAIYRARESFAAVCGFDEYRVGMAASLTKGGDLNLPLKYGVRQIRQPVVRGVSSKVMPSCAAITSANIVSP